jgi:hypothetical protein
MPLPFVSTPPVLHAVALTPGVHSGVTDPRALIAGQVDPHDPELGAQIVVNPREFGVTGWGDDNEQQFQSGHTNNLRTNPSSEQGFGVGPERQWPHYPVVDQPNPFRRLNAFARDGTDAYSPLVYRPEYVAYWHAALMAELGAEPAKRRGSGYTVITEPATAAYVDTVTPVSPGGY